MQFTLENKSGIGDATWVKACANHLAGWLYRFGRGVKGIELFGSIARGEGSMDSDFDLIICVSRWKAWRWRRMIAKRNIDEDDTYLNGARQRRRFAFELLKIDAADMWDGTGVYGWQVDVFLFPVNWRRKLEKLQKQGHHHDPDFMRKISYDARTFVSDQGFPFPVLTPSSVEGIDRLQQDEVNAAWDNLEHDPAFCDFCGNHGCGYCFGSH